MAEHATFVYPEAFKVLPVGLGQTIEHGIKVERIRIFV
jgi:hypothetical protein